MASTSTLSPSEARMARLRGARSWLDQRGARTKPIMLSGTPVPYYQVTGLGPLVTADRVIEHAQQLGWDGQ